MKVTKLLLAHPLVAGVIVLAIAASAGASTYWFNTKVSVSQDKNVITAKVVDCPSVEPSQAKAVGMKVVPNYSYTAEYKINRPDAISKQQVVDAIEAQCERRAIIQQIENKFADMTEFSATKLAPNSEGLYSPTASEGTVVAFNGNTVTLLGVGGTYRGPDRPAGETITLTLAPDALLTKDGKKVTSFKKGTLVYFDYQNKAVKGETPNLNNPDKTLDHVHEAGPLSVIRGMGALSDDNQEAIGILQAALNSGAVTALKDDPALG